MKVKLGGSKGKAWELDNVQKITVSTPYEDKTFIEMEIEKDGMEPFVISFNEAGTIKIDNRK